ncbi:malto-oligosyltrehalose trehalohydrolase [Vampirovibrio sp.]|uniref:malto-oligosyltrehalose trehalohydrolase n=1 Tax=Vampirovibrio sp. TaxID=2717857 RepID=UPI0035942CF2
MAHSSLSQQKQNATLTSNASHPFGPHILPNGEGVQFRLWAPSAQTVDLMLLNASGKHTIIPMQAEPNGWYTVEAAEAGHGSRYQFRINDTLNVPDPASRYQPEDVHGPSEVVDLKQLSQKDIHWKGRPWEEVVLYELHVGTFTPEGTYQGVKNKLNYLLELGVTAIELMPVADFPGQRNWGYDGVLPFAPDSAYGTPQDLKDLIEAAHDKGLMVFLDVVYNHFGPDGNYLHVYAQPFFTGRYQTPWGAALNFEGPTEVRQLFVQNAFYWLNEYRFDGLRFDAVHAVYDNSKIHFLQDLVNVIRQQIEPDRHVHLVLENDDNASPFLSGKKEEGYNAQWNDDFHHAAHVIATGEEGGYYQDYALPTSGHSPITHLARCLAQGFAYQGEPSSYRGNKRRGEKSAHLPPSAFVNFLQNHDQIGNRAFGDRLNQSADPQALKALLSCLLLSPSIPMLYMGQEWETEKPFQFFCDFEEDLAGKVREGRREEFAQFPEFALPENRERIPDPSAISTFEHSKLDWRELDQPKHANWLKFYQRLLAIRKTTIVPLIPAMVHGDANAHGYEVFETSGMQVRWRLCDGRYLQLTANLGQQALTAPPEILDNLNSERFELIDSSAPFPLKNLETDNQLLAWLVVWQIG